MEIDQDASEREIKKAFRRQSVKYHPDKNPGNETAAELFRRINRANEILTDSEKKMIYDKFGEDSVDKHERGEFQVRRGQDSFLEVQVTLEDLYNGAENNVGITKTVVCDKCKGTGAKNGKTHKCDECQGRGMTIQNVQVGFGMQMKMQQA